MTRLVCPPPSLCVRVCTHAHSSNAELRFPAKMPDTAQSFDFEYEYKRLLVEVDALKVELLARSAREVYCTHTHTPTHTHTHPHTRTHVYTH